ncbi:SDR family NAD(P)-dependent oxidoreductase [Ruegeria sp. EL01]|uniref:SDR family NAD(P)-dependent oxidoreductase n=1 Tax=Ruegeria sp. EL01 TaxID=2107578 RepID=UPI0013C4D3C3|nr:SDR family NAD(P)-dependent oxidoreductase [Ruegeria sp. EL01]
MDFEGKVAVITGAGSGIGKGIARVCSEAGMKLVLAGYNSEPLQALSAELSDTETLCVPTDVSQLDQVEALATSTSERFGQVDFLFNNAGVGPTGRTQDTSMEDWRWTLSVNLWGPINGVQVFLPIMERQGFGHINSTASESGLYGTSHLAAYNVSKFGVVGLMQSLERDLRSANSPLSASVFCPSAVKTEILDSMRNRTPESVAKHQETEEARQFAAMIKPVIANGMDPKEASRIVLTSIADGKFWIFSHPHVPDTAMEQAVAMVADQTLTSL